MLLLVNCSCFVYFCEKVNLMDSKRISYRPVTKKKVSKYSSLLSLFLINGPLFQSDRYFKLAVILSWLKTGDGKSLLPSSTLESDSGADTGL